jgi:hypothetical protein
MRIILININMSNYEHTDDPKSFKQELTTTFTQLSAHACSEVLILNRAGGSIMVFDNNNFGADNRILLLNGESIILRGLNNSNEVSAQTLTATGDIYYRANYFSNTPSR